MGQRADSQGLRRLENDEGARYTSTQAGFGPAPRGEGVRMRNRYEPLFSAPEIDVYCDPMEHSHAVVIPPRPMTVGTALWAAIGFSLVFAGIFVLANSVERLPRRSSGSG